MLLIFSRNIDGIFICLYRAELTENQGGALFFMDSKDLIDLFIYANKMEEERFVPVQGFEYRFWISDFGRLVSYDRRRGIINFLKYHIDVCGYYQTQLRMKPLSRKVRIHVLVAEHFCEKADISHIWVNHILGVKLWNYYKDLEWTTPKGNCDHALLTGLHNLKGEKHPQAKLNATTVLEMRELRLRTGMPYARIGTQYGVSTRQARDVVVGKNWGWLTDQTSTSDML